MRKLFITLLVLLLGTPLLSLSATTQEVEELFQEGKTICLIAARRCTFKMVDLDLPLAYTQYNDITIMSGIYNKLTKDELRGIIYHEVAHAVSNHSQQGQEFFNNFVSEQKRPPYPAEVQNFRYKLENEADAKAVLLLFAARKPILLDTALVKVTKPYNNTGASSTHPSIESRVKHIQNMRWKLEGN